MPLLVVIGAPLYALALGLAMNAVVGLAFSLLAIPIDYVATGDSYSALLAPSYGLAGAADTVQWVAGSSLLLGLAALPLLARHTPSSRLLTLARFAGAGALAGLLCLAAFALAPPLGLRRHYDFFPALDLPGILLAMLISALGACLAILTTGAVWQQQPRPTSSAAQHASASPVATHLARLGTVGAIVARYALVLAAIAQVGALLLDPAIMR